MSSEWPLKKISEIADFLNSKRIPLKSLDRQKRQGPYPYYGASGIVDSIDEYIFDGTYLLISEDGENLRTRKTPIAFKAHGKFWVNNHAHIISEKEEGVLDYLEYYFSTLDLDPYITGAVQPKLNKANLDSIEIPFPDKDTRLFINSTLNSLTQKVAINHKLNQTLEQMAQALFKSWFVDFEPVKAKIAVLEAGGSQEDATLAAMTAISGKDADALAVFEREHPAQYAELKATAELFPSAMQDSELGAIPEGWNIGKLGDIIEFNPKRVLKKGNVAPYLDMKNVPITGHSAQEIIDREFSSGSKFRNGDTLLARITPCLENGKTAFVDFLLTDEMIGWGSTEFIIMRSKKSLPLSLSYFLARLDYFRTIAIQSMQGTSGRQRADASVLEQHIWVVPPNEILKKFGIFSDSVLNCNRARNAENNALTQIRDTLLPKLLSGEITLPEAEQIISEEA
ncbi:restriction endonuclease subunit S [Pseudescherichia vulneris]|uniref:restriction endonuclease subunit S n=1 Tax=Pseudescherichia vulneris TaxID=566 RepID=UPI00227BF270|nr:restriction endonuclease subunit S [Pseudescherichia vulneris]WAH53945.1 restriction endonuclease subunit S [Pseudescherichia vulneris]